MSIHGILNFPRLKKLLLSMLGGESKDDSSADIFNPGNPPSLGEFQVSDDNEGAEDLNKSIDTSKGREQFSYYKTTIHAIMLCS